MDVPRRTLLLSSASMLAAGDAPGASGAAGAKAPMRDEPDAVALGDAMRERRTSAERQVQASLRRIAAVDRAGPRLRSVIELNPDALAIAKALDAERASGHVRGPLHGLPVLIKDNIATGDRMSTSGGSLALDGVHATRDARLVKRLREAGAVILGKTNLSEWANIRSTRSTSGWSGRGGLTRNPYALDRNCSGSSSGTGAAIAANLVALGVGTETDGSIVSPASICGLVGFKPTVGRISRSGVIPISHTQDTAGPMTRTVADAMLLYRAMAGLDAADDATRLAPADEPPASASPAPGGAPGPASARQALAGVRLGVARQHFTGFDEADAVIEVAIAKLRSMGAEIIDPVDLAAVDYSEAETQVLLHEFKADLAIWLRTFAPHAPVQSLADLIAFNRAHREAEMPWFAQELFEKSEALGDLESPAYREALARCIKGARTDGLERVFAAHRLDAVIAPTGGPAWLIDPVAGDHSGAGFSTPAAVAGWPHLTVPAGFVRGLPMGLSFVGPRWSDERVLGWGHAFEQATLHRRPPRFLARSVPP